MTTPKIRHTSTVFVSVVIKSCCLSNLRGWLSFFMPQKSCRPCVLAAAMHCVLMQSWGAAAIMRELCQEMCLGWGRYYPQRTCEDLDLLRKLITLIIIQGILKWSVLCVCVCLWALIIIIFNLYWYCLNVSCGSRCLYMPPYQIAFFQWYWPQNCKFLKTPLMCFNLRAKATAVKPLLFVWTYLLSFIIWSLFTIWHWSNWMPTANRDEKILEGQLIFSTTKTL